MDQKDEIMLVNQESLVEKIYTIRGQKVMLDFELAEIYGYETKRFNEQVKNNIEKFDDDFRFQLTKVEWENLRSKITTSKSETGAGGRRYLPYAFSEAGIYMLMTVLKGELAVKQSKALIRPFKQTSVEIIIFSDNVGKGLHTLEYQDFCKEYPFRKIKFQESGGEFHDRYIVIDWNTDKQRIYHCGASSKDAGQRITTISEVVDQVVYADIINRLLKNPILKLK